MHLCFDYLPKIVKHMHDTFHSNLDERRISIELQNAFAIIKNNRLRRLHELSHFHEQLSFKNEEQWLTQLSTITNGVQKDKWIEQELVIVSEVDDEPNDIVQIQYRDIIGAINFLIDHSPFRADLTYAPIRQFNDDEERMYIPRCILEIGGGKSRTKFPRRRLLFPS